MTTTVLEIKNMVCDRCVTAVRNCFISMGLEPESVRLGEVVLSEEPDKNRHQALKEALAALGFELLESVEDKLVNRMKSVIVDSIHYNALEQQRISDVIAKETGRDYGTMSKLFRSRVGHTIEQYVIRQKIEKAKEWIEYGEKNISEIAFALGYSSVAHFSAQFKKNCGVSPSQYAKGLGGGRQQLDNI